MGFPFIAPLKEYITQSIEDREQNQEILNTLVPFVVLSSAAVVFSAGNEKPNLKKIAEGADYGDSLYKGCVIANSTNMSDNYQVGETIVGYDLEGKVIKVLNESNRRVSVPIIESVEIDTDGNNNTLRTANVKVRVFTLKQLEMFELFFLRPSMNLVLEYGWNNNIRNKDIEITSRMFANKNHSNYLTKYSEIYSRKQNAYKIAKGKYLDILEKTKGNYDFMAGKVTNFNYSPEADGTYSISITISAGNELQTWMPIKRAQEIDKTSKQTKNKKLNTGYATWVNKLAADLNNPEFIDLLSKQSDWEKEFFNWGVVTGTQKETTFSKEPYISFKLILELLNNMKLFNETKTMITWGHFEDKAQTKPLIPISSNYFIISSTSDFILPGYLPNIHVLTAPKQKDIIQLDPEPSNKKDGRIYGKSFNLKEPSKDHTTITIYDIDGEELSVSSETGNLLNVYFKYSEFKKIYNGAYTAADVINGLLDTVNNNMYGLCNLVLQKESDAQTSRPLIIMDGKMVVKDPTESIDKIYRFKVNSINSIVKEFSFNMELSTLMQAQALYATQLALAAAEEKDKKKSDAIKNKSTIPERDPYQHADLSYAKNADNFFSINAIELQIVKDATDWFKIAVDSGVAITQVDATANPDAETGDEPVEAQVEVKNAKEVYAKNYLRFKDKANSTGKYLIYTDASLIQKIITPAKKKKNTSVLTYLDISLTIDGIAGISCGEYFHINGVPEIYNKNGYFQVTNVKQGIDDSGWKTTIEAGYRIKALDDV